MNSLSISSGEIIVFVNSGDLLENNALEIINNYFEIYLILILYLELLKENI